MSMPRARAARQRWLDPIEIAEQQGFKASDIKRILEAVNEHRNEILEAWNEFFRSIS